MTATATDETFIPAFERIVEKFASNAAVVENGNIAFSYAQLAGKAKAIASQLQKNDCSKGDVVAIAIEKSADYICSMLAIWYAGAAFVPLDPALPEERLALICKEAGIKTVLVQSEKIPSFFTGGKLKTISVDKIEPVQAAAFTMPLYALTDLAYIIFTSGSTGIPKGVMVTHRGIVSFLRAQIESFELTDTSRSLWYLSTSFDASVSDLGTALLAGAALYIESSCRLQPGSGLEEVLADRQITYVDIPPSMLRLLEPGSLPASLKSIVIGGEACSLEVVRAFADRVKLVNVYGPTESTVCTSLETCRTDRSRPLIGQPLPGITYRVLDENLNDVARGQAGQLHIGGIGLAAGYLNRPELTAAKFITHPISQERLYRTGDLIMLTEDGQYQFLGRTDRQLKLRGMLVEPEEIEARLLQHPLVERAAVLKRPVKAGVERQILVAFVTEKGQENPLELKDLRLHLLQFLPKWMIPQKFQKVTNMPLTVTGKVDLSALKSAVLDAAQNETASEDFQTDTARTLAQIFVQVLGVESVSPDDDFFDIGGDSFAVVEAVVAASALGLALPPALLMENPTIRALSAKLDANEAHSLTAAGGMKAAEILDDLNAIENGEAFQTLLKSASQRPKFELQSPHDVFFTGATGFLGARLLHHLLQATTAHFHCLVRAGDESSARGRIETAMAKHGLQLESEEQRKRIHPICGSLEKPHFDLPAGDWRRLGEKVDTIVHCAALVNNLASYGELRPSNVLGTVEVAKLALSGSPKCLHYAGTLSVFVATDRNSGVLKETDHLEKTGIVYGGYAQTKWAAEVFLRRLAHLIPTTQFRLGLITGDSKTGRRADHDFLTLFVRGLRSLGAVPAIEKSVSVDITPVDFAALAMVILSLNAMSTGKFETYHLANSQSLALDRLLTLLVESGTPIQTLTIDKFKDLLRSRAATLGPAEAAACLALCRLAGDDFEIFRTMDLFQATDVQFDTTAANQILGPLKITCPPPSDGLIKAYLCQ